MELAMKIVIALMLTVFVVLMIMMILRARAAAHVVTKIEGIVDAFLNDWKAAGGPSEDVYVRLHNTLLCLMMVAPIYASGDMDIKSATRRVEAGTESGFSDREEEVIRGNLWVRHKLSDAMLLLFTLSAFAKPWDLWYWRLSLSAYRALHLRKQSPVRVDTIMPQAESMANYMATEAKNRATKIPDGMAIA